MLKPNQPTITLARLEPSTLRFCDAADRPGIAAFSQVCRRIIMRIQINQINKNHAGNSEPERAVDGERLEGLELRQSSRDAVGMSGPAGIACGRGGRISQCRHYLLLPLAPEQRDPCFTFQTNCDRVISS